MVRLITTGCFKIVVFHNGIIVNADELFQSENIERYHEIDTEIIPALVNKYDADKNLGNIKDTLLSRCVALLHSDCFPKFGKLVLLSNNGSLYYGEKGCQVLCF